ncbi:MAG: hypothetical protein HYX67_11035 [Candidatus Melainabacteria bacterium]|nr:hypothetical protein [Candidatus Melainabacteria bacterium]
MAVSKSSSASIARLRAICQSLALAYLNIIPQFTKFTIFIFTIIFTITIFIIIITNFERFFDASWGYRARVMRARA